jgi:Na+/melibiose symporter-like transporter
MNQSKTKTKITLIAILAIVFVCALFVISIIEIRQYNIYSQKILTQEKQLEELKNAKNYYTTQNYKIQNSDLDFMEE